MIYKLLTFSLIVFFCALGTAQEKMESTSPNFTSFSTVKKVALNELTKFSSDADHPEYGTLPFNAPCDDCIEVIEDRTQFSRKYLTVGKNGKEFLIQKGYSPLHYKNDQGEWITYNPSLIKVGQSNYQTNNPFYEIEVNTQNGYVSLTNKRKNFQKLTFHHNLSLEFVDENGVVTNSIPSNWTNHIAGDGGVKIIDIFPNVDLEIIIRRDIIKTNFIIKSDLGGKFRIKEKINASYKSRLANNENELSVLNFFENGKASYSIGELRIFGNNTKNRTLLQGHYEVDGNFLTYNWDTDGFSNLTYPITIDPTVTSAGTLPQASFTDSGLNNAGAFTNACTYNLSVATPPNVTITDIDWTASYLAQNGATMSEGAFRFNYGACVSPSGAGFFWFCNDPFFGGTCNGANISMFSDFQACVPAPQCASYNMDFTMEFFDAFGGPTCDATFITSASDWTMTITGETVDEPAPPTSSSGTSICPGTTTTLNANGTFGVPGYSYSWSPTTNLDDPNVQSPVLTAPGTAGSTNYVCTITDACGNTSTNNITITVVNGPNAGIDGALTICETDPSVNLVSSLGGSPDAGGTWSPALSAGGNTFDPSLDGSGTYTYTVQDPPGNPNCPDHSADVIVTVTSGIIPTFAAVGPFCNGDAIAALPTTSTNAITGTWAPAINNTTTTTYTFTPTAGQCATTQTLTITITAPTTPTFAAVGPYCNGDAIPALPTTSTNAINGTWAPAINNTTTTTYTFTPTAGQCATTQTLTITITPSTTPTFAAVGPFCSGDAIPALPTTSTNAITGTWAPAINNTTTTTYTFTPTAGQCATTQTLTITITPNTTPTFAAVGPFCTGTAIPALPTTSTNGVTGTWSPAIDNTTTTTYTFTPTAGQCATTTTLTITISSSILPTFNAVGPYCSGDVIPALPTTSTNAITGTWSPAIDNTTTTTYTFTPAAGQCATTTTLTITIGSATLTPTFNAVGPYCNGDIIPALPTTSTNAITGTWAPAIDNTTTTTYTFTPDIGQCATIATLTITINAPITPTFAAVGPYCNGDVIPALPTTSTNAITGTWAPAINNTSTTTYTFTPTAGQCATTQTLTITVNPLPIITLQGSTNITDCLNPDGTITITANGTSYELFTSVGGSVSTNATGLFTGINAGNYYVETTLNGCLITSSPFSITNSSAPVAPVTGTDATYCNGDLLNDLTATAGSGGTLNWYSDAGLTTNIGTGGTLTPNNTIGATIYYVTETVSNCESPASAVTITINAIPAAPTAGTDATYCNGDPLVDLTTTATSPNWYSDAGLTINIGSGAILTPGNTIGATIYYVTETTNGCNSLASSITITINATPTITSETPTDVTSCISDNGTFTVSSAGTSFELFTSVGMSVSTNATGIFNNLSVGSYYVVVSNGSCSITGVTLPIVDLTSPTNQTINNPICSGSDYTYADGTIHTNITTNETYVSTLVSTIGCDSIITENLTVVQNITVVVDTSICEGTNYTSVGDAANFTNVLIDFTHTSTIIGSNGCDSIITENITVIPLATIDLGPDLIVCPGETITIDATTSTGVPIWNTGDTTLSLTVTISTATFFVASVSGSCGNATDTIFISVFPPFTVDAGPDVTIPLGASTQLNATGANSYTWSPSMFLDCSTCASPIAAPTDDITYVVTGYDENGCTETDTVIVIIDGEITIYFPNIFTPNGDGENDTFGPYGPTFTTFTMQIYNRWGGLVFETEIPGTRWDGMNKGGNECPQAVFTYSVRGMLVTGQIIEKAGNVMLAK